MQEPNELLEGTKTDAQPPTDRRKALLKLIAAISTIEPKSDVVGFRRHLAALLEEQGIDVQCLTSVAIRTLWLWPPFKEMVKDAERLDLTSIGLKLRRAQYVQVLEDPLVHSLLRRTFLDDLSVERILTICRRAYLFWVEEGGQGLGPVHARMMVSMACQCFNNEYVYPVDETEHAALRTIEEHLRKQIATGDHNNILLYLMAYAMYAPLWKLNAHIEIQQLLLQTELSIGGELLSRQISEHIEEERIQNEIPSSGMSARTSESAVCRQYEESPYPRWLDATLPKPTLFGVAMAERFPFLGPIKTANPVKILVAGCGTGIHALQVAAHYSDAVVLATDISKTSLSYAVRQARRYGISNIEFRQEDLLDIDNLGMKFDAIESVGVLHHLDNPVAGFQVLSSVLVAGGFLRIAVYSRRGRERLERAKRQIRSYNVGRSADELRDLRQKIIATESQDPRGPTSDLDFFYLSGFRDMLCHAQEVLFTPAELREILENLNLEFLGYRHLDVKHCETYRKQFPQDPEMRDLELLERFEFENPEMFRSLQFFWARKVSP
jgi:SAM-dependent methyltransferase